MANQVSNNSIIGYPPSDLGAKRGRQDNASSVHLLSLPDELLANILNYIPTFDPTTRNLGLSCRRIREIQFIFPKIAILRSFLLGIPFQPTPFKFDLPSQFTASELMRVSNSELTAHHPIVPDNRIHFLLQPDISKYSTFIKIFFASFHMYEREGREHIIPLEGIEFIANYAADPLIKKYATEILLICSAFRKERSFKEIEITSWDFLLNCSSPDTAEGAIQMVSSTLDAFEEKYKNDPTDSQFEEFLKSLIEAASESTQAKEWLILLIQSLTNREDCDICSMYCLDFLPIHLKSDKDFILRVLAKVFDRNDFISELIDWMSPDFKTDIDVWAAIARNKPATFDGIPENMRNQKKVIFASFEYPFENIIHYGVSPYRVLSDEFKNRKDVLMAAIRQSRSAYEHAPDHLKNDPDILKLLS